MQVLNFTATEILPSLLNKEKKQTIRASWKKPIFDENLGLCINGNPKYDSEGENPIIDKLAQFKVGEEIKLMWNQRSKSKRFCCKCGKGDDSENVLRIGFGSTCCKQLFFNKILGTAKVTEVFQIEMGKDETDGFYFYCEHLRKMAEKYVANAVHETKFYYVTNECDCGATAGKGMCVCQRRRSYILKEKYIEILAKDDGFKTAKDMFEWFDSHYSLDVPKKFWVYRWYWDK